MLDARAQRREAAADAQVEQQSIDELEGRVRDQLLRARRCVERARASGVKVTAMSLTRIRASSASTSEKTVDPPVDPAPKPA